MILPLLRGPTSAMLVIGFQHGDLERQAIRPSRRHWIVPTRLMEMHRKGASHCKAGSLNYIKGTSVRNFPFQAYFLSSRASLRYSASELHNSIFALSLWSGMTHWEQDWRYWSTWRLCLLGRAKAGQVRVPGFQDSWESSSGCRDQTPARDGRREERTLYRCLKQQFIFASYLSR